MKACPICKRPDLANGLARCPQCNADLECFDLLETLQEQATDQALLPPPTTVALDQIGEDASSVGERHEHPTPPEPGIGRKWPTSGLSIVLALVLLVLAALMALVGSRYLDERFNRLEDHLASVGSRSAVSPVELPQLLSAVQDLNKRLEAVEQGLSDLTAEQMKRPAPLPPSLVVRGPTPPGPSLADGPPATTPPMPAPEFSDYHAAPSETLWGIAERFYGKGIYYPVLLEDNPGLAIYGPPDGRIIRIARQPEHAPATYRRLVHTEGGDTLFSHRAQDGDSWHSLARAFYGSTRRATELAELNRGPQPKSGQRVLIPLD